MPLAGDAPWPEPVIAICQAWRAKNAEVDRLNDVWGKAEAWLAENHHWFALSDDERYALPQAQPLHDTHRQRAILTVERDGLIDVLPAVRSMSCAAVALKLTVVAQLLDPTDQPDAHALVESSIRDLQGL